MAIILVVDDDELVLQALRSLLESDRHSVLTAASAQAAIRIFEAQSPDLVLVDILMPEMDGIEMIRILRMTDPDQKIVALSGGGRLDTPNLLEMVEGNLGVTTIAKPITNSQFLQTISAILAE